MTSLLRPAFLIPYRLAQRDIEWISTRQEESKKARPWVVSTEAGIVLQIDAYV